MYSNIQMQKIQIYINNATISTFASGSNFCVKLSAYPQAPPLMSCCILPLPPPKDPPWKFDHPIKVIKPAILQAEHHQPGVPDQLVENEAGAGVVRPVQVPCSPFSTHNSSCFGHLFTLLTF